jgi:hypothetical protein
MCLGLARDASRAPTIACLETRDKTNRDSRSGAIDGMGCACAAPKELLVFSSANACVGRVSCVNREAPLAERSYSIAIRKMSFPKAGSAPMSLHE